MFGWPHVLQDLHERMQTGRMHSNRASLPGLARWMQDEGGRLTRQSHRPERLHPLMQVTKQHLSFFLHPFMQPHQTLSFLNCVPSSRIYNAAPTRKTNTPKENITREVEMQIWKTMFEWFGCHPTVSIGRLKTTLFLSTCDIANPVCLPIHVPRFSYQLSFG